MSGIYGLISNDRYIIDQTHLPGIQVWNRAYGKAAQNSIKEKGIYLGCCKDVINTYIDMTDPVIIRKKNYYVIDALLYNRDELIKKTGLFENVSDEELLVEMIEQFGFNALESVNGDFAGAFYDPGKKELILFRDHMGVRPLFYFKSKDYIVFSTDIRSITGLTEAEIRINEDWLYRKLSGRFRDGLTDTEYENVFCVLPGSYIRYEIKDDGISENTQKYWEPGRRKIRLSSDQEYQKEMRRLITDAVERRLNIVEGEVGAELSGGLDSSVIDILINRTGRKCTYVSWSESPEKQPLVEGDERLVIKDICDQEGIECTYEKTKLDDDSPMIANVRETGVSMDVPSITSFVFPPYINTLRISNTASLLQKKGIRVCFTGHGGDEGVSHRPNPFELFYHHEYLHYLRYMWSTTHGQKRRAIKTLRKIKSNISQSFKRIRTPLVEATNAEEMINPAFKTKYEKKNEYGFYFGIDPKKYIKDGGSRKRLDNLALQGAYCGVRYLIPYLDHRVIDFAVSIPRYQYLRGHHTRYVFREAFKDIMPESLYRVTTKSENSRTAQEPDPDWYEGFFKAKAGLVEKFDRRVWEDYLDFEKLKEFSESRKTVAEDRQQEYYTCICFEECLTAQNVLEKTREVSVKQAERIKEL